VRLLIAPGRPAWTLAVARALGPCRVVDPLGGAFRPVELGLRLWGRRAAREALRADSWRRQLAGLLSHVEPGTAEVIAPSLAALELFADARALGARCTLLADLPDFATLHEDLDAAAARWPDCALLRNHRAPTALVERQQGEWRLADRVFTRSRFAAAHAWALRFPTPPAALERAMGGPVTIRLAGLATARSGAGEALAALERLPGVRLSVRLGPGSWPTALAAHPRVVGNAPCDLLWAPSWVETGDAEVAAAARLGIPIVATDRGAGWSNAVRVARGDVDGLLATTRALLLAAERREEPARRSARFELAEAPVELAQHRDAVLVPGLEGAHGA
jgi:hypothetical protein